jgi:hypothetical protein
MLSPEILINRKPKIKLNESSPYETPGFIIENISPDLLPVQTQHSDTSNEETQHFNKSQEENVNKRKDRSWSNDSDTRDSVTHDSGKRARVADPLGADADSNDTITFVRPDKLSKKAVEDLYNKMRVLFNFNNDEYKKSTVDEEDNLKENVRELYKKLNTNESFNDNSKYTYTFNITLGTPSTLETPRTPETPETPGKIQVKHNLFGDLFMLRSEIPHDFKKIKNKELYKTIITLSIREYIYSNYSNDEELIEILENILKVNLNEARSGISVLELIYASGIPLIKQHKSQLDIEVGQNENDSCIFPLVFNDLDIQIVSDADSQANKFFSQIKNLYPAKEINYPFLKFDAGSAPTFYSHRDNIERREQLDNMSTLVESENVEEQLEIVKEPLEIVEEPLEITVLNLFNIPYIDILYDSETQEYRIQFTDYLKNELQGQLKNIIENLNSNDILKIINQDVAAENADDEAPPTQRSAASISSVTSIVNKVLEYIYENINISGIKIYKNSQHFLEIQVERYKEYIEKLKKGESDYSDGLNAKFICNILLNIISIKSLGDLVPYYVTLMQIMIEKKKLQSKITSTVTTQTDPNLNSVVQKLIYIENYLGVLGSGDYSLIQSALINVNLLNTYNEDAESKKYFDYSEIISCVHIKNSDITLPITETSKNIFRLMSCLTNSTNSCPEINMFDNVKKQLIEQTSLVNFMNIQQKIDEIQNIYSESITILKDLTGEQILEQDEDFRTINITSYYNKIIQLKNKLTRYIEQQQQQQEITAIDTSHPQYCPPLITQTDDINKMLLKANITKIDNFINEYYAFNKIMEDLDNILNNIIDTHGSDKFFTDLKKNNTSNIYEDDTNQATQANEPANVTITNPNMYFLCKYIIDKLNNKVALSSSSTSNENETITSSSSSSTSTEMSGGGKPNKLSKFKTTKKHNKKQYKKKTRKY